MASSRFVGIGGFQPTGDTPAATNYTAPPAPHDEMDRDAGDAGERSVDQVEAFLEIARQRFRLVAESEAEQRADALDDMKFKTGDQWPLDIKAARDRDGRPCLTINRIPQFVRQVTNDQRQNRPGIQVNPVGAGADVDTAEVIEGLIRHIESNNADVAYDTAFDYAASTGGPGYIRILTRYVGPDSFDQEIYIDRVLNPMTVYIDPDYKEPDGRDMRWAFIVEDLSREEYKLKYPGTHLASLSDFASIGDKLMEWANKKTIRVAEYWYIEEVERELCLLQDGRTVFSDELQAEDVDQISQMREVKDPQVKWAKINAVEIIDERTDYPGKHIPIVPVLGDENIVDGKRKLSGLIRFAKDPQRAYNYWTSAETESIALAPKAPFIVEAGQVEGYEHFWRNLNTKNYAYLPYKAKALGDKLAPPPQRSQWEPPIQAIALARAQSQDDLKATTGIYDASLGARGNETSGRAILARQREGDVANFHLIDNLSRSIRQVGRIVLDLIPHVYDAPRIARIIGRDNQQKLVTIQSSTNPNVPPAPPQQQDNSDIDRIYDVGVGRYDVTVTVGPSFNTKRQESVQSMLELTRNFPAMVPVVGDLLVSNMDWPGAKEIAERLRKVLPPELQDSPTDGKKQQQGIQSLPPAMQQQIQQLVQQHDQLTQMVQQLTQEKEQKTLELQNKIDLEKLKIEAQIAIAEINAKNQEAQVRLKFEQDMWRMTHENAHEVGMAGLQSELAAQNAPPQQAAPGGGGASEQVAA